MPITAYIGLGSNIGDRKGSCLQALELLSRAGRVKQVSSYYCTEPVGNRDQEEFVNAVAELETSLSPEQLLAACRAIEDALGRRRSVHWGPRTIDLDILLYGDQVIESTNLTIPHPFLTSRGFVLIPLCEIAPQVVHPILKKTAAQLLHELKDPHRVVVCGP
jgi:2-amino-4-hydroxy-6-hydroxymethyldihydropteridine diphosphokinase